MQRLSRINFLIFLNLLLFPHSSFSQNNENFRTPAKLYAGAYTVKVQLKKDFTEYDIPMWIKPDQAESAIDATLLKDLGYVDREIEFQEVKISNEIIEKKKFKNQKTEWAFVPDFAKSCCYGVIGRDILDGFEIRFDPKSPTHLEWTRIIEHENPVPMKADFLKELKKLFSLTQPSDVPFTLNLQERKLEFEGKPMPAEPSLFSFFFVPPDRVVKVMAVLPKYAVAAKKAGLIPGMIIDKINGEDASGLDRWVIEKYLRGQKGVTVKLTTPKKTEINFDFSNHQFK